MMRGLRRKVCFMGISLSLLMAMVGCGGGGGGGATITPPNNNPVPSISGLSPASATVGAAAQTLTINGTNFLSTSTATYNDMAHTATFVSATELTIQLSATDQMTAGNYPVVVTNPAPGGGSSTAVNFTVNNPVPMISGLSPASAAAGAAAQTLTIDGTNFLSASTVTYNNMAHTATFVSATKLKIQLSATDQMTAGNYPVVVTNPAPGGGSSPAVNFVVSSTSSVSISISPTGTQPLYVKDALTGITATVSDGSGVNWTVNDVLNGSASVGTITVVSGNTVTYTAPTTIPGTNPVKITATSQENSSKSASLMVKITNLSNAPNAITVPGDQTIVTGVNLNISTSSPTLGLSDVGTCGPPYNAMGICSASVIVVPVSKATGSYTIWLLGQGLTSGAGLNVSVSGSDVPVSDVTVQTPFNGLTNLTFNISVSSAGQGVRNIVVTNSNGEIESFVGAIQIVP